MSNGIGLTGGTPSPRDEALALAVVGALACLVLAVFAFTRPLERRSASGIVYQQSGVFSYSAEAAGGIYRGNRVTSGQPIYLRLVRGFEARFDYQFAAQAAHNLQGTYRLSLELGQDSGWQRTVEIVPETPFQGDRVSIPAIIDLTGAEQFMDSFGEQTGVRNLSYTFTLVPELRVRGTLAGKPVSDQFDPRLPFRMDSNQLALDRPASGVDLLKPSQAGFVSRPRTVPNEFSVFGLRIPVALARFLTLPAFLLASLTAVRLAWPRPGAGYQTDTQRGPYQGGRQGRLHDSTQQLRRRTSVPGHRGKNG